MPRTDHDGAVDLLAVHLEEQLLERATVVRVGDRRVIGPGLPGVAVAVDDHPRSSRLLAPAASALRRHRILIPSRPNRLAGSRMALYLTEADVSRLIGMEDTLEVLDDLFAARSRGEIVNRPRRPCADRGRHLQRDAGGLARRGASSARRSTPLTPKGASFQIVLHAADGSGLLAVMGGRADQRPADRRGHRSRCSCARRRRGVRPRGRHRRRVPGDPAGPRPGGRDARPRHPDLEPRRRRAGRRSRLGSRRPPGPRSALTAIARRRPRRRAGRRDDHELGRTGAARGARPAGDDDRRRR